MYSATCFKSRCLWPDRSDGRALLGFPRSSAAPPAAFPKWLGFLCRFSGVFAARGSCQLGTTLKRALHPRRAEHEKIGRGGLADAGDAHTAEQHVPLNEIRSAY